MKSFYGDELRQSLADALGNALGIPVDAGTVRLPAREAHASYRPPQGANAADVRPADFAPLYGAPLVSQVRLVNGWLLFDCSAGFFSALVEQVNRTLPLPTEDCGIHAINRMRALSRHCGSGCPDIPAFHRALILALVADQSPAAARQAGFAATALFHSIPPKDRPALLPSCGALGGALARLLASARLSVHPSVQRSFF